MSATRTGRRSPALAAIAPLVGVMLIGTTLPVAGASLPDAAPPPRLRLAVALEDLTAGDASRAERNNGGRSDESPGMLGTPLQLATALLSAVAAVDAAPSPASSPSSSPSPPPPSSPPPPAESPRAPPEPASRREGPSAPASTLVAQSGEAGGPDASVSAATAPGTSAGSSGDASATTVPATAAGTDAGPAAAAPPPAGGIAASVVGDGEFLPADELDDALPAGPRPPPEASGGSDPARPSRSRRNWGLAPVRWGGEVSAGFRRRSGDEGVESNEQVYEGRLRANTFIMRPYIALVSGDFGLTMVRSQTGDAASSNLTGTSINGTGTLSVFPQSRFPFQATLALSDSRSDGSLTNSNIERRRLALRQDYRPLVGNWRASGQYDRSELTGSFGVDTVDRLAASLSSAFDKHSFSTNGSFSRNESRDQSTDDFFALGTHGYRFSDATSIDTSATFTRQEFEVDDPDFQLAGSTQSAQVFSYLSWTPTDSPWRGTGNLRYFQTDSESGETSLSNRNFGGSASLSYLASRNLSVFGSVGANSSSGGETSTNQNLGLNYNSDPRTFGQNNVYNWFAATSLSNATSSEGDAQRGLNASLGHSLSRTWQPSAFTFVNGSLNQSVGNTRSTGVGSVNSTTLSHGASLSLQANDGDRMSGFISTSVSDSRVSGDSPSTFQMLNVQLSGRWRINAYSELNSNLTWQLSRQDFTTQDGLILTDEFGNPVFVDASTESRNSSISGNVGYMHARAFGVRGMRYTLDFRANTARDNARRRGDPDAEREPDRATLDLDQRLRYSIGRLDTELQLRIAEIEGRRNELLFFRVSRHFGAF